jgi:hypothetical protein
LAAGAIAEHNLAKPHLLPAFEQGEAGLRGQDGSLPDLANGRISQH